MVRFTDKRGLTQHSEEALIATTRKEQIALINRENETIQELYIGYLEKFDPKLADGAKDKYYEKCPIKIPEEIEVMLKEELKEPKKFKSAIEEKIKELAVEREKTESLLNPPKSTVSEAVPNPAIDQGTAKTPLSK